MLIIPSRPSWRPSRRALICGGVVVASLGITGPAQAFQVQPLSLAIRSAGRLTSGSISVLNGLSQPLSIEVKVERLTIQDNGDPIYEADSGDEFIILPPQATIAVGATQVFRIRWAGDPDIPQSKLYMFNFQQVPVRRPNDPAGVRVLYSIGAAVAVAPPGFANLTINEAKAATTKEGQPGVEVLVINTANVHGYVPNYRISVRQLDANGARIKETNIDPGQVGAAVGVGLVPAFGRRRFVLPLAIDPNARSFTAEIQSIGR